MSKQLSVVLVFAGVVLGFVAGRWSGLSAGPVITDTAGQAAAGAVGGPGSPPPQSAAGARGGGEAVADGKAAPAATRIAEQHPTKGPDNAPVVLVEISDFECPFCGRGAATVQELVEKYGDKLQVAFVNLPLAFHANARPAALAALAAHRQGRFWAYHDRLFRNRASLNDAFFVRSARELHLDIERFERDRKSPELARQLGTDVAIAHGLGVTGTPGFFVNGVRVSGAQPVEYFTKIIDGQLTLANDILGSGVDPSTLHARLVRQNAPEIADKYIKWFVRGDRPEPEALAEPAGAQHGGVGPATERPTPTIRPGGPSALPAAQEQVWQATVRGDDPQLGPRDAPVTVVVFADFECPFTARVWPQLRALAKAEGDDVRVVFKHMPLEIHDNAFDAAAAAQCGAEQGRFWQMADALFDGGAPIDRRARLRAARAAGLDRDRFVRCMTRTGADTARDRVRADLKLGQALAVSGTPTLFVNGTALRGVRPPGELAEAVQVGKRRAAALTASGVAPTDVYATLVGQGRAQEVKPEIDPEVARFETTDAPRRGSADAATQLVVFKDLQCPFCGRLNGPLDELLEAHGEDVAVVFKHFPLSSRCNPGVRDDMHPAACLAAAWAIAADAQGRFWPFERAIFERMDELWTDEGDQEAQLAHEARALRDIATSVGLDVEAAASFVAEKRYEPVLQRDVAEASRAQITGTPALFINGHRYTGPRNADALWAAARKIERQDR